MSKLFRALLISAIATGTAVVVVNMMQQRSKNQDKETRAGQHIIDADTLSEEDRTQLANELDAML